MKNTRQSNDWFPSVGGACLWRAPVGASSSSCSWENMASRASLKSQKTAAGASAALSAEQTIFYSVWNFSVSGAETAAEWHPPK